MEASLETLAGAAVLTAFFAINVQILSKGSGKPRGGDAATDSYLSTLATIPTVETESPVNNQGMGPDVEPIC